MLTNPSTHIPAGIWRSVAPRRVELTWFSVLIFYFYTHWLDGAWGDTVGGADHDSQWSRLFGANGIVSKGAWVARARSLRCLDVLDVLPQLSAEAA